MGVGPHRWVAVGGDSLFIRAAIQPQMQSPEKPHVRDIFTILLQHQFGRAEPSHPGRIYPASTACLLARVPQPAEGGASEMKYRFYATRDGVPLRLWMMGTNLYSGGQGGGWSRFS